MHICILLTVYAAVLAAAVQASGTNPSKADVPSRSRKARGAIYAPEGSFKLSLVKTALKEGNTDGQHKASPATMPSPQSPGVTMGMTLSSQAQIAPIGGNAYGQHYVSPATARSPQSPNVPVAKSLSSSPLSLPEMLKEFFRRLQQPYPAEPEVQSLVAAIKASADKKSLPLSLLLSVIGLDTLHRFPERADKLADITFTSFWIHDVPSSDINIIPDPRSILQLKRIAWSSKEIGLLFKMSEEPFKHGLGIDKSWNDDGLLSWLTSTYFPIMPDDNVYLSPNDISAIFCSTIYSELKPQVLTGEVSVTKEAVAEILNRMKPLLHKIATRYLQKEMTPPYAILLEHKPGPLQDDPVAFDIREGADSCFNKHPRIGALLDNLRLISADRAVLDGSSLSSIESMFHTAAYLLGLGAEDMWWLMFSPLSDAKKMVGFENALASMYNISLRPGYYWTAPNHGVLGWGTLSWLLGRLVAHKKYPTTATLLDKLKTRHLVPEPDSGLWVEAIDLLRAADDSKGIVDSRGILKQLLGPQQP